MIAGLGPRDRVAVIGFAGSMEVALRPTAADEPEKILAAIDGLRVRAIDGARDTWTRAWEAVRGARRAGEVVHVVVATDGELPGGFFDRTRLREVVLSVIEVGIGDVWDVPLVEAAREHDGQLFHADTGAEAGRIFGRLARQGAWVARDVQGRTTAERAAIGLVRAEAVRRFLVEQAHVSPAQLEVRPARPEDRPHHGDPAANRSVRFNFVQRGLEQ